MINEDLLLDYYEKGWELGLLDLCDDKKFSRSLFKFRLLSVIDLFKLSDQRTYHILDIACGVGTTSFLIARKFRNTEFCCIDISRKQVAAGQEYVRSIGTDGRFEFLVGDVCQPIRTSRNEFDYIICCEILEHLQDPDKLLRNVRRYGSESTKYIFSVPHGQSTNNDICYRVIQEDGKSIVINDPAKLDEDKKYYEFYHKSYSIDEAVKLFSKSGYEILNLVGAHFLASSSLAYYVNRLTHFSYAFDKYVNKITLNKFAGDIIFLCKKV